MTISLMPSLLEFWIYFLTAMGSNGFKSLFVYILLSLLLQKVQQHKFLPDGNICEKLFF